jgi:hypothetical protein
MSFRVNVSPGKKLWANIYIEKKLTFSRFEPMPSRFLVSQLPTELSKHQYHEDKIADQFHLKAVKTRSLLQISRVIRQIKL